MNEDFGNLDLTLRDLKPQDPQDPQGPPRRKTPKELLDEIYKARGVTPPSQVQVGQEPVAAPETPQQRKTPKELLDSIYAARGVNPYKPISSFVNQKAYDPITQKTIGGKEHPAWVNLLKENQGLMDALKTEGTKGDVADQARKIAEYAEIQTEHGRYPAGKRMAIALENFGIRVGQAAVDTNLVGVDNLTGAFSKLLRNAEAIVRVAIGDMKVVNAAGQEVNPLQLLNPFAQQAYFIEGDKAQTRVPGSGKDNMVFSGQGVISKYLGKNDAEARVMSKWGMDPEYIRSTTGYDVLDVLQSANIQGRTAYNKLVGGLFPALMEDPVSDTWAKEQRRYLTESLGDAEVAANIMGTIAGWAVPGPVKGFSTGVAHVTQALTRPMANAVAQKLATGVWDAEKAARLVRDGKLLEALATEHKWGEFLTRTAYRSPEIAGHFASLVATIGATTEDHDVANALGHAALTAPIMLIAGSIGQKIGGAILDKTLPESSKILLSEIYQSGGKISLEAAERLRMLPAQTVANVAGALFETLGMSTVDPVIWQSVVNAWNGDMDSFRELMIQMGGTFGGVMSTKFGVPWYQVPFLKSVRPDLNRYEVWRMLMANRKLSELEKQKQTEDATTPKSLESLDAQVRENASRIMRTEQVTNDMALAPYVDPMLKAGFEIDLQNSDPINATPTVHMKGAGHEIIVTVDATGNPVVKMKKATMEATHPVMPVKEPEYGSDGWATLRGEQAFNAVTNIGLMNLAQRGRAVQTLGVLGLRRTDFGWRFDKEFTHDQTYNNGYYYQIGLDGGLYRRSLVSPESTWEIAPAGDPIRTAMEKPIGEIVPIEDRVPVHADNQGRIDVPRMPPNENIEAWIRYLHDWPLRQTHPVEAPEQIPGEGPFVDVARRATRGMLTSVQQNPVVQEVISQLIWNATRGDASHPATQESWKLLVGMPPEMYLGVDGARVSPENLAKIGLEMGAVAAGEGTASDAISRIAGLIRGGERPGQKLLGYTEEKPVEGETPETPPYEGPGGQEPSVPPAPGVQEPVKKSKKAKKAKEPTAAAEAPAQPAAPETPAEPTGQDIVKGSRVTRRIIGDRDSDDPSNFGTVLSKDLKEGDVWVRVKLDSGEVMTFVESDLVPQQTAGRASEAMKPDTGQLSGSSSLVDDIRSMIRDGAMSADSLDGLMAAKHGEAWSALSAREQGDIMRRAATNADQLIQEGDIAHGRSAKWLKEKEDLIGKYKAELSSLERLVESHPRLARRIKSVKENIRALEEEVALRKSVDPIIPGRIYRHVDDPTLMFQVYSINPDIDRVNVVDNEGRYKDTAYAIKGFSLREFHKFFRPARELDVAGEPVKPRQTERRPEPPKPEPSKPEATKSTPYEVKLQKLQAEMDSGEISRAQASAELTHMGAMAQRHGAGAEFQAALEKHRQVLGDKAVPDEVFGSGPVGPTRIIIPPDAPTSKHAGNRVDPNVLQRLADIKFRVDTGEVKPAEAQKEMRAALDEVFGAKGAEGSRDDLRQNTLDYWNRLVESHRAQARLNAVGDFPEEFTSSFNRGVTRYVQEATTKSGKRRKGVKMEPGTLPEEMASDIVAAITTSLSPDAAKIARDLVQSVQRMNMEGSPLTMGKLFENANRAASKPGYAEARKFLGRYQAFRSLPPPSRNIGSIEKGAAIASQYSPEAQEVFANLSSVFQRYDEQKSNLQAEGKWNEETRAALDQMVAAQLMDAKYPKQHVESAPTSSKSHAAKQQLFDEIAREMPEQELVEAPGWREGVEMFLKTVGKEPAALARMRQGEKARAEKPIEVVDPDLAMPSIMEPLNQAEEAVVAKAVAYIDERTGRSRKRRLSQRKIIEGLEATFGDEPGFRGAMDKYLSGYVASLDTQIGGLKKSVDLSGGESGGIYIPDGVVDGLGVMVKGTKASVIDPMGAIARSWYMDMVRHVARTGGDKGKEFFKRAVVTMDEFRREWGLMSELIERYQAMTMGKGGYSDAVRWLSELVRVPDEKNEAYQSRFDILANGGTVEGEVPARAHDILNLHHEMRVMTGRFANQVGTIRRNLDGKYELFSPEEGIRVAPRDFTEQFFDALQNPNDPINKEVISIIARLNRIPSERLLEHLGVKTKEFTGDGEQVSETAYGKTLETRIRNYEAGRVDRRQAVENARRIRIMPTEVVLASGERFRVMSGDPYTNGRFMVKNSAQRNSVIKGFGQMLPDAVREKFGRSHTDFPGIMAFAESYVQAGGSKKLARQLVEALTGMSNPAALSSMLRYKERALLRGLREMESMRRILLTTKTAIYNIPESLSASPVLAGWGPYLKGFARVFRHPLEVYKEAKMVGAIMAEVGPLTFGELDSGRNLWQKSKNLIGAATNFTQKFSESIAYATANAFARSMEAGGYRDSMSARIRLEKLDFDPQEIDLMLDGRGGALYDRLRREITKQSGAAKRLPEGSYASSSNTFNLLFPFNKYFMTRVQMAVRQFEGVWKGLRSGDPKRFAYSLGHLMTMATGATLSGYIAQFLGKMIREQGDAKEAIDQIMREMAVQGFWAKSLEVGMVQTIFGGLGNSIMSLLSTTDPVPDKLSRLTSIGQIAYEITQFANLNGPYTGQSHMSALATMAQRNIPILKEAGPMAAMIGMGDNRYENEVRKFGEWRRAVGKPFHGAGAPEAWNMEHIQNLRKLSQLARKALPDTLNSKDPYGEARKFLRRDDVRALLKELTGGATGDEIADALNSKRMMPQLSIEDRESLRKWSGDQGFEVLAAMDGLLGELAKAVRPMTGLNRRPMMDFGMRVEAASNQARITAQSGTQSYTGWRSLIDQVVAEQVNANELGLGDMTKVNQLAEAMAAHRDTLRGVVSDTQFYSLQQIPTAAASTMLSAIMMKQILQKQVNLKKQPLKEQIDELMRTPDLSASR